jgi:hypothetical protein
MRSYAQSPPPVKSRHATDRLDDRRDGSDALFRQALAVGLAAGYG